MLTRARAAASLLPLIVLAGCAGDDSEDSNPAAADSASACAPVEGDLIDADAAPGEPTLALPLPSGWESNTQMNSELVRLAVTNPGISRDGFAPNVVVTAEPSPADVQAAFDRQLAGLEAVADPAGVTPETGEICGHESMTLDYTLPAMGAIPERPAQVQIIVVPHGQETITYAITAQASAPSDPSYEQDLETMFSGVQIND